MADDSLFSYTFDDSGIREKVRNKLGQFQKANQAVLRANQASVKYLGQVSAKNLKNQIRRRGDPRNLPGVLEILTDPAASKATVDGFEFMVHELVFKISKRTADYYRVIEGFPGAGPIGTDYWVERTRTRPLYLAFLGYPTRPDSRAIELRQAAHGGLEGRAIGGGKMTVIRNPVPAYHYMYRARQTFLTSHQYNKFVYAELRAIGITVDSSVRPARKR